MMSWLLWSGSVMGQDTSMLYGYRFGHFENISDPERSAANVRRHLDLVRRQGVPIESLVWDEAAAGAGRGTGRSADRFITLGLVHPAAALDNQAGPLEVCVERGVMRLYTVHLLEG